MQVYHGTQVRYLPDIVEFDGLFCQLDLTVKHLFRMQKEEDYGLEELSESEIERMIWDGAKRRKNENAEYEFDKDVYVYVSRYPHGGRPRWHTWGVILGFDIDPSILIERCKIFRSLPLTPLNSILYTEQTNLEEAGRIMHSYTVPHLFYDQTSDKIISLEERQAITSPRGV